MMFQYNVYSSYVLHIESVTFNIRFKAKSEAFKQIDESSLIVTASEHAKMKSRSGVPGCLKDCCNKISYAQQVVEYIVQWKLLLR